MHDTNNYFLRHQINKMAGWSTNNPSDVPLKFEISTEEKNQNILNYFPIFLHRALRLKKNTL